MKIDIVNNAGEKISSLDLNKAIWGTTPHRQAQFDTLLSYNAQQRQGTHKVKNRAEVSGGGRKPWKQKGTGNARQGSIRAPQWKGGGVVFGPTPERNYTLKVNKKIRNLALKSALAAKLNSKNVIVINELVLEKPSTKAMLEMLTKLDLVANKTLVIIDHENQTNVIKSVSNLERTHAISAKSINIYDLLNAKKILITASAIKTIEEALK